MASPQNELVQVIESLEASSAIKYAHSSVLAFLIYDTALQFDDEVKYFWEPPKNAVSYLYFMTRYTGIIFQILSIIDASSNASQMICNTFYLIGLLGPVLILCIEYILLLRVRALYSKGKTITAILAIAFTANGISAIAIAMYGVVEAKPRPAVFEPGLSICTSASLNLKLYIISWSIPLVYGTFLMTLALYKAAKILKEDLSLSTVTIVKTIVRDQAIYFMALITISVTTILAVAFSPSEGEGIIEEIFSDAAILSSIGSHLLLNMKEAGAKGLNEGMGSTAPNTTISGMNFAAIPTHTFAASRGDDEGGETEIIEV